KLLSFPTRRSSDLHKESLSIIAVSSKHFSVRKANASKGFQVILFTGLTATARDFWRGAGFDELGGLEWQSLLNANFGKASKRQKGVKSCVSCASFCCSLLPPKSWR